MFSPQFFGRLVREEVSTLLHPCSCFCLTLTRPVLMPQTSLGEYSVPKGRLLFLPTYALHRTSADFAKPEVTKSPCICFVRIGVMFDVLLRAGVRSRPFPCSSQRASWSKIQLFAMGVIPTLVFVKTHSHNQLNLLSCTCKQCG